jgi:pimeloyl-ACP methyl ester carboxylesterase
MVHGITPTTESGLESLREKLSESGFAKIGVAELASAPLIALEIKRNLKCDPDARFVLLGYDLGAAAALWLARDLLGSGVPVEAVILLDPIACGDTGGVPTLRISSAASAGSATPFEARFNSAVPLTHASLVVPDANHFKLPAHPQTVAAISALLKGIAVNHYHEPGDPIPYWTYEHAPEMHIAPRGEAPPEWNFLADSTETPPAIIARPRPRPGQLTPSSFAEADLWRK